MGKAIPDTEILLVNDNGQLCKPDEVGELVHRGPTVSMGYWGLPDATTKVLRPNPVLPIELQHSGERVCYSGDLVKMDSEGFLYYVGRRDATIKSSGYRISPTEVEEVLFATGLVREAAVIGVPDDVLGQAIKAFVVPLDGREIREDSVKAFCAERIPRYMIPRNIEVLPELPKTGSGKIDYPSLKRKEMEKTTL
jgi:acyl-CoA synthetase (AMP-forming)/AMP-acid ligase II